MAMDSLAYACCKWKGWMAQRDVPIAADDELESLLWENLEAKLGSRADLPGTLQRCRIVVYDTPEVLSCL